MNDSRKKRMSFLDSLSAAGAPAPAPAGSMMVSNRALRSARDAVDAHHVWELDPDSIDDGRLQDRIAPAEVDDLRAAIETNGQAVPILVRRHPSTPDRYLLVYGRRRLEAIRQSDKIDKVRALVASLNDDAAVRTQIAENMARRDLSFIEKALFAKELIENGFGNQNQVAEVLTVTKSSVSMALAVVDMIGPDLIRAIGAAHGVGRPRWETLGRAIVDGQCDPEALARLAEDVHTAATVAIATNDVIEDPETTSVAAFEAVLKAAQARVPRPAPAQAKQKPPSQSRKLVVQGKSEGAVRRTAKGIAITLENGAFADWVEREAQTLIEELHERWSKRAED